jgi:SAM-dependent methyltransferase
MRSMSVGRLLQYYVRTQLGYTCTCCGSGVGFGEFGRNPREAGPCLSCGASNRNRQMAHIVRKEFGLGTSAPLRLPDEVVVYNTESTGAVHAQLKNSRQYIFSEYFGHEFKGGELVNGVRHEDVMEHMPDPYRAHSEIFRALKPGGKHIFTAPYDPGSPTDDCRAELHGDEVLLLKPALYHGDPVRPDEGVLVWFIFGREMSQKLQAIGFEIQTLMLHAPKKGIIGEGAIVFVATKPARNKAA